MCGASVSEIEAKVDRRRSEREWNHFASEQLSERVNKWESEQVNKWKRTSESEQAKWTSVRLNKCM